MRLLPLLLLACATRSAPPPGDATSAPPLTGPPLAPQRPVEHTLHGHVRTDPWAWLNDPDDPEVRAHLEAEAAWSAQQTAHLDELRETLLREAVSRQAPEAITELRRFKGFTWRVSLQPGADHPLILRCPDRQPCDEVLDVQALAADHPHVELGAWQPSPDHKALAYTIDLDGDGAFDLHLPDHALPDVASGGAWSNDGRFVYYLAYDDASRPARLHRHELGTPPALDTVVYEERDERFHLSLRTQGGQLWIEASSSTTDEVLRLPLDQPTETAKPVWPRQDGVRYRPVLRAGTLYTLTNRDEPTGHVLVSPLNDPTATRELPLPTFAEQDALEQVDALRDGLALTVRLSGQAKLVYHPLNGADVVSSAWAPWTVPFDLQHLDQGDRDDALVVSASAWTKAPTLFTFDAKGLQPIDVGWTTDPTLGASYTHSQRTVIARDGQTELTVTLLHRSDTPLDGTAPLFLTAYGAYGATWGLEYEDLYLSLADRGVIVARAHVRGGGERGPAWHDAGRMAFKHHTFTDTIDVARALTDGLADPRRVALYGLSAGGALVGAVINQEPDLFRAAVAEVPFVDVLTTMSDPDIPLTVTEWEEWGNPGLPEQYAWMAAWSPYDNVRPVDYPPLLVTTAWHDDAVGYWEPAKWVQRVRTTRADTDPTLLHVRFTGGHSGTPGRFGYARDQAWVLAWVLDQLGAR